MNDYSLFTGVIIAEYTVGFISASGVEIFPSKIIRWKFVYLFFWCNDLRQQLVSFVQRVMMCYEKGIRWKKCPSFCLYRIVGNVGFLIVHFCDKIVSGFWSQRIIIAKKVREVLSKDFTGLLHSDIDRIPCIFPVLIPLLVWPLPQTSKAKRL